MPERIILSFVSLIMLVLTIRRGDKLATVLSLGFTAGVLITWIELPVIKTIGLVIYMLTALLVTITSLNNKEHSSRDQVTMMISGIWAFGANLFSIMEWPYAGIVRLSMIIPIILFLVSLINGLTKRKEIGYLTIMNVEFLLRLIR